MRIKSKSERMNRTDLLAFLTLPIVFTGVLIYDTHHSFLKIIAKVFTGFLLILPSWLMPIAAPLSLLTVFLGLPMLLGRLFRPEYSKIVFSSMSLSFAILLIYFMISLQFA